MDVDKKIEELVKVYQRAADSLIEIISIKEAKGSLASYQKSLLSQVYTVLEGLNVEASKWANEVIPEQYNAGINNTNKMFGDMGIPIIASFSRLHTEALNFIVENTISDLVNANNYIGRIMGDNLRQIGLEVTAQKVAQGQTVREVKKQMLNRLIDAGINGIRTRNGRVINIKSYAELVARSTSREAYNRATLNQVTNNGYDLVKMSSHLTTCPVCAPLQGRVYSISGNDNRYPHLNKAFGGIYANIHPNCKHSLAPYIPELADNADKDKVFSNKPFNIDPRSQEEIDRYNLKQKENQSRNNDRRLYERYKTADTDGTPKTFSGFRKMKSANSDRYKELQSNFRKFRQ